MNADRRLTTHARHFLLLATALFALGLTRVAADEPVVSAILTSARSRASYLAHATMWREPRNLTPEEIADGPSEVFPYAPADALAGVDCTFLKPGRELGGKSAKFLCGADGRTLRLKYWDAGPAAGNREVFATVAATRLMWALGFEVLPALPINVRCHECPGNPETGEGARSTHEYLGEISIYPPSGPKIVSRNDLDQGWSWRELDEAIRALPDGPERTQQRMHFDALTLLGVFLQHGDRKPEQQVLYCDAPVDIAAGTRETAKGRDPAAVLVERPGSTTCPHATVAVVDVGATFGGAGRTSSNDTAKMNLEAWRSRTVFKDDDGGSCHGRLTVSLAAGHDGEGDPEISEDGRRFLATQLSRLTPAHVRAIFGAARVDRLDRSRSSDAAIDQWVAAFEEKARQITARQCRPASD